MHNRSFEDPVARLTLRATNTLSEAFLEAVLTIPDSIEWTASGVITIAVVILAKGHCAV